MARTPRTSTIGVGPALRRARAIRGISLDAAARDTKLRTEQLQALEDEDFDLIGGEVYARATLRTYAEYLGLNGEKVLAAYARHAEEPAPPKPPSGLGRVERAIAATRVRDSQRFLLIAAGVVLGALIIVGLVSRRSAPVSTSIATAHDASPTAEVTDGGDRLINVAITATAEVDVTAVVDGLPEDPVHLREGEVAQFSAQQELSLTASDGGAVAVDLNGKDLGAPGPIGGPWTHTFTLGSSPSP
jgi:cytoskeleton protein RodZ